MQEIESALRLALFPSVVEPSIAHREVAFAHAEEHRLRRRVLKAPHAAVYAVLVFRVAVLAVRKATDSADRRTGIRVELALLVSGPAEVGVIRLAREDADLRLKLAHELEHLRKAVVVAADPAALLRAAVPSVAAVRPVEPHLEHFAVVAA